MILTGAQRRGRRSGGQAVRNVPMEFSTVTPSAKCPQNQAVSGQFDLDATPLTVPGASGMADETLVAHAERLGV